MSIDIIRVKMKFEEFFNPDIPGMVPIVLEFFALESPGEARPGLLLECNGRLVFVGELRAHLPGPCLDGSGPGPFGRF